MAAAEPVDDEPVIPARRLSPADHLSRAAKSELASDAEHYHLAAAQAEAITRGLAAVVDALAMLADIVKEARRGAEDQ